MPLVDASDLTAHAAEAGYQLCAVDLLGPEFVSSAVEAAERAGAPIVLSVDESTLDHVVAEHFMPAVEAAAHRASVPVAIRFSEAASVESARRAIALGCNLIAIDPRVGDVAAIIELIRGCDVPVEGELSGRAAITGYRVDLGPSDRLGGMTRDSYLESRRHVQQALRAQIERALTLARSNGRAAGALGRCRRWRNVEHCIFFNANDPDRAEAVMANGRAVLANIPGVRRVLTGQSLRPDAKYVYCWLIRFAHPSVVDSYRVHPDHVAFADREFRPLAPDRLSIDFEEVG